MRPDDDLLLALLLGRQKASKTTLVVLGIVFAILVVFLILIRE